MSDTPPPPFGADPNQPPPSPQTNQPPNQPPNQPYPPSPYQQNPYQQGGQQVPYGTPQYNLGYGPVAPDHPQANTVLVLGILGIVVCGILAPFAWVMGNRVLREIDASNGQLGGRSNANAGRICGIIGTILIGVGLLFAVGVVIVAIIGTATSGSGYSARAPGRYAARATAPPLHRGRPADPRGAVVLAARQPVHAEPGRGLGGAPRGVGDPGRGGRRARVRPRRLVRARGATGRGDRLRDR